MCVVCGIAAVGGCHIVHDGVGEVVLWWGGCVAQAGIWSCLVVVVARSIQVSSSRQAL